MTQQNLNNCSEPTNENFQSSDPYPTTCEDKAQFIGCDGVVNLYNAPTATFQGLDADIMNAKEGLGEVNYCDPMTTGDIVEDQFKYKLPPDRSVIYRYDRSFRAIDEAVSKLFYNIKVIDTAGKVFKVPIIWGTQEKAVAVILQTNVRKDNTGVVGRIILPALSIYRSSIELPQDRFVYHMAIDYKRGAQRYNASSNKVGAIGGSPSWTHQEQKPNDTILGTTMGLPVNLGYTLTIWTYFWEDMNQILTEVATKFSKLAYIQVQGITNRESIVRLDSISNNFDVEPGDIKKRVFRAEVTLTAESYISQPIVRRKSVLKTSVDFFDSITDSDIANIISRIDESIED